MTKKRLLLVSIAILAVLLLAGCAAGTNPTVDIPDVDGKSAGFWSGLWHGIISPITFIISLFSDNVNVYEVYNSGNWYDFGFMFGVCFIFSGGAYGAKWKSK
ncbi:unnamed protein product [marine sediment metagenome]|uniref:Lipoprotein n=1 Tax=marine sediment metagenome TaxID=412755 RepID=X1PUH4_9ZZZZ